MHAVNRAIAAAILLSGLAGSGQAVTDIALIRQATRAAPSGIAAEATVMVPNAAGGLRMLREGSNAFTCLPATPELGFPPMCLDDNGLAWFRARRAGVRPLPGMVGFGYALSGGAPGCLGSASACGAGGDPYVMIVNLPRPAIDHRRSHGKEELTQPQVILQDTQYEYLMIPVR